MTQTPSLDDKYRLDEGRAFVTGLQAVVLITLMQGRRDRAQGLDTGGFISGYRGSPLSGLDDEFGRAKAFLDPLRIKFQGGVNEALAATAVWGSQNVALDANATVQGVFGLWYGKGPGLDQAIDVLRHANNAGVAPLGGALAVVGDDHALKSSALPAHCEPTFADLKVPVLYPSTVQEIVEYGLIGYALSRFAGCWVGLKLLPETVNTSAVIDLALPPQPQLPEDEAGEPNRYVQWPDPWGAGERRQDALKASRILEFLRLNGLNRVMVEADCPRFGVIAPGKSYQDLREAFRRLGLSDDDLRARGVSLFKVGAPWPLEPEGALDFARRHETVLVVEEKRPIIEDQLKTLVYDARLPAPPVILGRRDAAGAPLFSGVAEISPEQIAGVLARLLDLPGADAITVRDKQLAALAAPVMRTPFFCSGCPHNTSTRLPEGSEGMAGIGCHGMVMWVPERNTHTHTHMGGEGATWVGRAPFTATSHIFQNIGDGTFHHSGSLAVRQALAAGVNITYKVLVNDAVAMTGGQAIDGGMGTAQISRLLRDEGVERIALVAEHPDVWRDHQDLAPGVTVHPREDLDAVQRELRDIPGVTALIYDQVCATEKRRRRKRGRMAEAPTRTFINDRVCEGCGDCSVKSNCLSVVPLETEFGRKRQIDQVACNKDLSCVKGFCPSFVLVEGGLRKPRPTGIDEALERLPAPRAPALDAAGCNLLFAGVGGMGVVTASAILGVAAQVAGVYASVHDRLGMAQKFGSVTSHLRLTRSEAEAGAARIPMQACDVVIGADLIVTAQPDVIRTMGEGRTRVVVNLAESAPSAFVTNPDFDFRSATLISNVRRAAGEGGVDGVEAARIVQALTGDTIGVNMFLVGRAWQGGLIPLPFDAIDQAIAMNGAAVAANRRLFALGRLSVADPDRLAAATARPARQAPQTLDALVADRRAELVAYQDERLAARYEALVRRVEQADSALALVVARTWFKLLAYKDEYEVARLYADPAFRRNLEETFEGPVKLKFLLAPPLLSRPDPVTGEPRKLTFGAWMLPVFRLLAKFKRLRGGPFDLFGGSADRRLERRLITEYEALVEQVLAGLRSDNAQVAAELLSAAERIRGYGPVKERSVEAARERVAQLLADFSAPASPEAAAPAPAAPARGRAASPAGA